MPRAAKELTALKVARLTDPGLYAVGGAQGLHLQVTPSGARSWIARLTVGTRTNAAGKTVRHRRDFGLGAFPAVSLAEAREKAREFRTKIATHVDPLAEKFAAKARAAAQRAAMMTVNTAVQQFIEDMQGKWAGDPKGVSKRQALLKTYITPHIGDLLITDVEVPHVVTVLKPVWEPSPATAERVASLLRNTFDWAKAHGYRTGDNPASSEVLNKVLPSLGESGKQPALPFASLPAFTTDLRARENLTARALEVTGAARVVESSFAPGIAHPRVAGHSFPGLRCSPTPDRCACGAPVGPATVLHRSAATRRIGTCWPQGIPPAVPSRPIAGRASRRQRRPCSSRRTDRPRGHLHR